MFEKKRSYPSEKSLPAMSVQTIPADFYGGVNPVVKFKKIEKEILFDSQPNLTSAEKKMLDDSTSVGSGESFHVINIFTNRKYALIFWSGLFFLVVAGAGLYYYLQVKGQTTLTVPNPPQIDIPSPPVETPIVETTTIDTSPPSTTEGAPESLVEAPIDFPSNLLGDSADLDKDNITDIAEELFGTDPSKPDTDEDSYNDGREIFYLHNPAGKEPMRLVESGYVKEYKNPIFGYSMVYPINWAFGSVDQDSRQVLFSTITGENIEIRTFDLQPNQTFSGWFAQWAPGQRYDAITDFQTRFFEFGKSRADSLVYYFYDANHVYVLLYHTTDSNVVNYRSVLVMMARSFRSASFVPPDMIPVDATSTTATEMPASISTPGAL